MTPNQLRARLGLTRVLALLALAAFAAVAEAEPPASTRVLQPQDLNALNWRSIGPANMGGRLAAIALAPGISASTGVPTKRRRRAGIRTRNRGVGRMAARMQAFMQ